MKNFVKTLIICVALSFTACNSDDDKEIVNETGKSVFENNTAMPIVQAIEAGTVIDPIITPSYTVSTITVDRSGTISKPWKVSVHLNMSSGYGEQYTIELFAPTGQSIKLFERLRVSFLAGNTVTFNSGAVGTIQNYTYPVLSGSYLPSSGLLGPHQNNLATFFEGKEIDGEWKLKITAHYVSPDDDDASNETLNGWKLEFADGALE